jgi:hypothetical protein
VDGVEKRSVLRRRTTKKTSVGLNVSPKESAPAAGILPGDAPIGFLRRSGSRESIHRKFSPRALAPSLWVNPMPPRITPESYRPRVSDRTMVATWQSPTLVSFEKRTASSRSRA